MQIADVKKLIEANIENCEAIVTNDGGKYTAIVVADCFENMSLLAKQKMVFATVNQQIQSGEIHALTIKAYTKIQWEAQNN